MTLNPRLTEYRVPVTLPNETFFTELHDVGFKVYAVPSYPGFLDFHGRGFCYLSSHRVVFAWEPIISHHFQAIEIPMVGIRPELVRVSTPLLGLKHLRGEATLTGLAFRNAIIKFEIEMGNNGREDELCSSLKMLARRARRRELLSALHVLFDDESAADLHQNLFDFAAQEHEFFHAAEERLSEADTARCQEMLSYAEVALIDPEQPSVVYMCTRER